ncbi:MAG: BppU family phage baseplate upper protein [Candidatus Avispirillum sp.]
MVITNISLDVSGASAAPVIRAKKGDSSSRTLIISLCSGTAPVFLDPSDTTVTLTGKLKSSSCFAYCTIENGSAVYTLENSFTSEAGRVMCELSVYKSSGSDVKVLYSPTFILDVSDNLDCTDAIEADDRYTGLSALVTSASACAARAESAESLAEEKYNAMPDSIYSKAETDAMLAAKTSRPDTLSSILTHQTLANNDRITVCRDKDKEELYTTMGYLLNYFVVRMESGKLIAAESIFFDNENSELESTDVYAAIEELLAKINALSSRIAVLEESQNA